MPVEPPTGAAPAVEVEFWVDALGASAEQIARTRASLQRQTAVAFTIADQPMPGAPFALWINAGAVLRPHAARALLDAAHRFGAHLVYGDGAQRVDGRVRRVSRPDFSPIRLLEQDFLGDAVLVSRTLAAADTLSDAAGLRDRVLLRVEAERVVHVPEVVVRRRDEPPVRSRREAVTAELARRGANVTLQEAADGVLAVRFVPSGDPLVSIIIPTRGSSAEVRGARRVLVVDAVKSIVERSTYPRLEIVVVVDGDAPQSVVDELGSIAGDRLVIVRWSEPFNFSAKLNRGAAHAQGDYLLLLNDDIEVITPDWIETMLGLCQQPGVGLVGAHLVFEDGTLQHGGHFYEGQGAGHIGFEWRPGERDALDSLNVDHEVSGVTAACALVSRTTYLRAGGFSALLPGNYNDVDFSLKVRSLGESIVWTPAARLFHFESKTREPTTADSELATLRARWGSRMEVDGYWRESIRPVRSLSVSSNGPDHPAH